MKTLFFLLVCSTAAAETIWIQQEEFLCGENLTLTRVYDVDESLNYTLLGGNVVPRPQCPGSQQAAYDESGEWLLDTVRFSGLMPILEVLPESQSIDGHFQLSLTESFDGDTMSSITGGRHVTSTLSGFNWLGPDETLEMLPMTFDSTLGLGADGDKPNRPNFFSTVGFRPAGPTGDQLSIDWWNVPTFSAQIPVAVTGPWLDPLPTPDRIIRDGATPEPGGLAMACWGLVIGLQLWRRHQE